MWGLRVGGVGIGVFALGFGVVACVMLVWGRALGICHDLVDAAQAKLKVQGAKGKGQTSTANLKPNSANLKPTTHCSQPPPPPPQAIADDELKAAAVIQVCRV